MRIAFCVRAVFPQHGYGGMERAATSLVSHLIMHDVDVALHTRALPAGQPFATPIGAGGRVTLQSARYGKLPLRPNGIPARLTNYRAFVDHMGRQVEGEARAGHLDAVYANGLTAFGVRHVPAWGVPLIVNPHGMEEFHVSDPLKKAAYAPFRAWMRAAARDADRVIATDAAMKGDVARLLRVDTAKVVVIPNGVDIAEVRGHTSGSVQASLSKRFPRLGQPEIVLRGISVGRLEENKGFDMLLDALKLASPDLPASWAWTIVGDGSRREALVSVAERLGIAGKVIFTGQVSDAELHNLYAMSDLFVHPTRFEGSSIVTLEAMAHSLPVVASAVGGIPDKVVEGRTGFLVPPGEPHALAEKIIWIATRPETARDFGERGAELAENNFAWDRIAARTADLCRELVDARRACRAIHGERHLC